MDEECHYTKVLKLISYYRLLSKHLNGSKILNWVLKRNLFKSLQEIFVFLSRKTLDRFFILLRHCFYTSNTYKKAGLNNWFVVSRKNLCSCVQQIKNKHDGGANVFFVSACVTHSLVENATFLRRNKGKSPGNKEAQNLGKIYRHKLLPPHSQRSIYREMKEEITSQKRNYSKPEKTSFKKQNNWTLIKNNSINR